MIKIEKIGKNILRCPECGSITGFVSNEHHIYLGNNDKSIGFGKKYMDHRKIKFRCNNTNCSYETYFYVKPSFLIPIKILKEITV